MLRQDVFCHVRRLAGHLNGELAIAGVVVGEGDTWLERNAGMAAEMKGFLDPTFAVAKAAFTSPA